MARESADDIARKAWGWFSNAETVYLNAKDRSADQMSAIQAMSAAALAALKAEELDGRYKN